VLHEKVLQPECRARVKAIGAVLRAEDGLARACDLLEQWMGSPSPATVST